MTPPRLEIIPGADHGLGFYGGDPTVGVRVIELTTDFLVTAMFRARRSPNTDF